MKISNFFLISLIVCQVAKSQHIDLTKPHETWSESTLTEKKTPIHFPVSKFTGKSTPVELGPFTSYQVNIIGAGLNAFGDAANEPSIAVNPQNPNQIVIGWRQFNNISSSFREAGISYSDDGGITWHNIGPFEAGVFRSDPVLAADADGTFFYQSLKVVDNGIPGLDDDTFQVDQWRSIDGGKSWFDKTNAIGGDKSWYAIDNTNNNSRGNIYAVWNLAGNNHYPRSFNYSTDNGQSYSTPEELPNSPIFGTVAIGFDGEVYIVGINGETELDDFYMIKSNNISSVLFPDFVQSTQLNLGGALAIGGINPLGLLGQTWVAVDKSNRHTRGNIYVAASVDPSGLDPLNFNFIRSRDDGLSFTQPQKINDDSSNHWQWLGTMGVAPNGRIDFIWLDTRNSPNIGPGEQTSHSQLFYSYSYDGGISFSKNQPVSTLFNHGLGYPVQRKMGDYIDIVSDNLGAHVAYTGTFTGGQDVYYLHAKPAAFEENPYFPSHEMDGIWHNPQVPRQGILSKTLVPGTDNPELVNFEAVFTETPEGQATWFVLQSAHPVEADSIEFIIMHPTGDLNGVALRPIGIATKSRLYDDGELIKNQLLYHFNMTDDAIDTINNSSEAASYDQDYFVNNPFYQTEKSIQLTPVVATEQDRDVHCLQQNLVFENPSEKAEGRLPVAYQQDDMTQLFVADFTYVKTTDPSGTEHIVLNQSELATPTWRVMNSQSGDLMNDSQITNDIYLPVGGNGFFNETSEDTGVQLIGTETLTYQTDLQVTSLSSEGVSENFVTVAFNSYCGDIRD